MTEQQQTTGSSAEQVIAIQYRRIRFRFYNSSRIGAENLDSVTRWKCHEAWTQRGQPTDIDDIIEATLDSGSEEEDEDDSSESSESDD